MLFNPLTLGKIELSNRIVMAPMTRSRSSEPEYLANEMMLEYYRQRASAGLIVSEGLPISTLGRGYAFTPGLYTKAQVASWQRVTKAVHQQGGVIFAQLWHVGRTSHRVITGGETPISASATQGVSPAFGPLEKGGYGFLTTEPPKEMTHEDIHQVIDEYVIAAKNALDAGFDGIELHGANGYLIEQFMHQGTNKRQDEYGGSEDNRIRFALELVTKLVNEIGADRVAIRLSPFLTIDHPQDDLAMPETVLKFLEKIEPLKIAYVHFSENVMNFREVPLSFREQVRRVFSGKVIIAGRYTKASAEQMLQTGLVDLVAFGEPYIANPDLVYRFEHDRPLNQGDKETYYGGEEAGLIDYGVVDPKVFAEDIDKLDVQELLLNYYGKFDRRDDFSEFEQDFTWDNFAMISPGTELTSEQAYREFYSQTTARYLDSHHHVANFMATRKSTLFLDAECDLSFEATMADSLKPVLVKGRAYYRFTRTTEAGPWKVSEYRIEL